MNQNFFAASAFTKPNRAAPFIRGMKTHNRKFSEFYPFQSFYHFYVHVIARNIYYITWYGKEFIKIDQWYPSSKTCSCCGHKLDELAPVEYWTCPKCKTEHDRDFNASLNILAEGLRVRAGSPNLKARGEPGSGFDQVVERSETRLDEARIVERIEPMSGTEVRYA